MIEFIKQLVIFLAALFQSINQKTLIDAGSDKQELETSKVVLDHVKKADDIRDASSKRTTGFFVRKPDGE